jgi:hypothetical protein
LEEVDASVTTPKHTFRPPGRSNEGAGTTGIARRNRWDDLNDIDGDGPNSGWLSHMRKVCAMLRRAWQKHQHLITMMPTTAQDVEKVKERAKVSSV